MPELPEVHTIVTDLKKHICGFTIDKVTVTRSYNTIPGNAVFLKSVEGQQIIDVERIAKNILISLQSKNHILIHLAMTGKISLEDAPGKIYPFSKVQFEISKDGKKKFLIFSDVRMFGKVAVTGKSIKDKLFKKYGPDILQGTFSPEDFHKIISSKRTSIKNLLMDQGCVSGLGNIYATDTLFLARVHPQTKTQDITFQKATEILEAARLILNEGIKNRGSTLPDAAYVDIFGRPGLQQNHFRIYMRENCPNCKTKVSVIKILGRGTYFCPNCQSLNSQPTLFAK